MTIKQFNNLVNAILEKVKDLLCNKTKEYSKEELDRLDHFKRAAILTKQSPVRALYGMLVKHIISLSDFICSEQKYSRDKWYEKIFDNINYLLLLCAAIEEFDLIKEK